VAGLGRKASWAAVTVGCNVAGAASWDAVLAAAERARKDGWAEKRKD
jgi:hypothetical protein